MKKYNIYIIYKIQKNNLYIIYYLYIVLNTNIISIMKNFITYNIEDIKRNIYIYSKYKI